MIFASFCGADDAGVGAAFAFDASASSVSGLFVSGLFGCTDTLCATVFGFTGAGGCVSGAVASELVSAVSCDENKLPNSPVCDVLLGAAEAT